ncbi:gliding motility-associated C-terminal domain-containing protein, partial [Zhouia amylolytica]
TTAPDIDDSALDNLIVECDGTGNNGAIQDWLDNNGGATATDNCGTVTWTNNYGGAGSDCSAPIEVIFTATDECGNQSSVTATYAIEDTTAPTITTDAADETVECDGSGNATELQAWLDNNGGAIAEDDCSAISWTNDFNTLSDDCGATGSVTVTFTATDGCGNFSETTATFTIEDTIDPSFNETLPVDVTVECDAVPTAEILTANDACSAAIVTYDEVRTDGSCPSSYILTRTWTATDECGNDTVHVQTITVEDTTAPAFVETLPADTTVECDAVPVAETLTATDNCGDAAVTFDEVRTDGACVSDYTLTRTWTATDECGLETVHVQTITVQDTTAPDFVEALPADTTVECDAVPVAETLTATDNCGDATVAFDEVRTDGACVSEYTLTRTWTATDECGLETVHVQTITVQDTTAPEFVEALPADATIECDAVPVAETLTATDNCGDATVTYSEVRTDGACVSDYTLTRTWTATDECGLETVHVQTITVQDTTAPDIDDSALDNLIVECDGTGNNGAIQDWLDNNGGATATDNCGTVTWTNNYGGAGSDCSAPIEVIFTATDECGNQSSVTATYAIEDTTAPTITTDAADETVECDGSGNTTELQAWLDNNGGAIAEDDCSVITWTNDFNALSDECGATGSVTVTFTATDGCGNFSETTATFTIEDTIDPSFNETLPVDVTVECDGVPTAEILTANDACSAAIVTYDEVRTDGSCPSSYILTRTWTATDECGNDTVHVQTITVEDTTAPVFVETLPADATVECDAVPVAETLTATDNCGDAVVTYEEVRTEGNCVSNYTLTRTWTATDECGLETEHVQTITVQDTTAPTASNPTPVTVECFSDVPDPDVSVVTDAADNCTSVPTVVFVSDVSDGGACPQVITRTYSVSDDCGNTTEVTQTITVEDTTLPTFTVPGDVTLECDVDVTDLSITGDVTDEADNCSTDLEATFSDSIEEGECAGESMITRTWTLVDDCGNTATDIQIITLMDTTAPMPTVTIDSQLDVTCDAIPVAPEIDFTDACGEVVDVQFEENSTKQDNVVADYTITRTWTVTDSCNNTAEYVQVVNVAVNETRSALREIEFCVEDAEVDLEQYLEDGVARGGRWTIKEGLINLIGSLIRPSETELGVYTVEYTETVNDCPQVREFRITVHDECVVLPCGQDDIVVSKVITPNNDVHNQYFEVNGATDCGFTTNVKIFNRWGTVVYESDNYQNNWDGTTTSSAVGSSRTVPAGTYYYVVELENSGLKPITGYIYVGTK